MTRTHDYGVRRISEAGYQLLRISEPFPGPIASILRVVNRQQQPIGWRLKPRVTMQGSASKIWQSPAEVLASTKLMTFREANAWIAGLTNSSG